MGLFLYGLMAEVIEERDWNLGVHGVLTLPLLAAVVFSLLTPLWVKKYRHYDKVWIPWLFRVITVSIAVFCFLFFFPQRR